MIVYEFYLNDAFKARAFEALCDSFTKLGNVGKARKVDGVDGPAIYAVSRNPNTNWVQLLVEDDTPGAIITAIESKIDGLCDTTKFAKFSHAQHNIAPAEGKREEIGI